MYVRRTKYFYHSTSNLDVFKKYFGAPSRFTNPKKRGEVLLYNLHAITLFNPLVLVTTTSLKT